MGLEQVKKEIIDNSKKDAERIINEGKAEAGKIILQAKENTEGYRKEVEEDTGRSIENMEKMEIASANFEIKKRMLDKKKELIEKVFENVKAELKKMPPKKREMCIKKLEKEARKEIDVRYIYANENDKSTIKKMKGKDFRKSSIIGGIIAENSEQTMSVDYSFEELLSEIKDELLPDLAEILFKK